MGLSQIPILPWQHSHAAGVLLLARWPSGAECPLGVAAEEDGLLDRTPPPPPLPHSIYTHSHQSRGQATLGHGPLNTIEDLRPDPPPLDRWGGQAPFEVWAEPAWSPRGVTPIFGGTWLCTQDSPTISRQDLGIRLAIQKIYQEGLLENLWLSPRPR